MQNCEYFLVQYAPSALRETRVAIGLFLFEERGRLAGYRITQDWRHVRCLDPEADLALLGRLPDHFERLVSEPFQPGEPSADVPAGESLYAKLHRLREDASNSIQISSPRGVLAADPQAELLRLYQEHVERPRPALPKRLPREGSRRWIYGRLREALERHALWDSLHKEIPVEQFTAPGDGFRLDFGYRPNGIAKYLHALSLERDWNQAKLLSYTFWRMREQTEARVTAIVADADPALPTAQSCRRILTDAQVAICPLSLLDPLLREIQSELRVG